MKNKTDPQKKVRRTFIYLSLLFIVPLVLASWMVLKKMPLSLHTTNHGQLLQPPLQIQTFGIALPKNGVLGLGGTQDEKNRWVLLYIYPHSCDAPCEKALYDMRQVRTAMGKDIDRVERAILTTSDASDRQLEKWLQGPFEGTAHVKTTQKTFSSFLYKKNQSTTQKMGIEGIYIVDPLGNLILFYPPAADSMGIFKDLTRVLKLSHIG
jgi:hypothetical protein